PAVDRTLLCRSSRPPGQAAHPGRKAARAGDARAGGDAGTRRRRGRAMKRAAVIGAGFGGLALAIRLQSAGVSTTLIEARDRPGGRAYVWERDGFVFDAGPTVITDPDCLR